MDGEKIANCFFASLNIEMCLFSFQRDFTGLKEGSIAYTYVGRLSELGKRERRGDNRRKVRRMHRRRQNLLSFFYFVVAAAEILALLQGHSTKKARKFLPFGKYDSAHLVPLFPGKKGLWHGGEAPLSAPQYPPLFSTKPIFWNFLPQGFFSYGTHAAYAFRLISIMLSLLPIPLLQPRL